MLARPYRITKNEDFERIKKEGKTVTSQGIILSFMENKQENTRFGFIVSKNVSKNATKRNYIKRAMREAVRHEMTFIKKGFDLVFVARPLFEKGMTDDIMDETKIVLEKSGLLK